MSETYGSYLKLDELLSLQVPKSEGPEHDEHLFIVVHQVYELWFKQVLHECDHLQALFAADQDSRAAHTLGRILRILKVMVSQIDVLETMTPLEFLSFRSRLESASGFQSWQFRALEFCFGAKNRGVLERFETGSAGRRELERRFRAPSLWESFVEFLRQRGYAIPPIDASNHDSVIDDVLVGIYRTSPSLAELAERFVDLDEGLQEWRYRHVKMVERTIGTRPGTGGSKGVEYLTTTLMRPAFPSLWRIRARL